MFQFRFLTLVLSAATAICANALAQDAVITRQITQKALAEHYQVDAAMAAINACSAIQVRAAVSIVDNNGNTRLLMLGDKAKPAAMDVARRKAYTAAIMRRSSSDLKKAITENPHMRVPPDPSLIFMAGGIPIRQGSEVIGGIGVSGGKPEQDESCAQAGLDKIKSLLQ